MNVTQARIRKAKQEVSAYLESHPNATTRQIAMELNMADRSVLYRKKSLGILPKPSRISLVKARVAEGPCTDEEMAEDLNVPLKAVRRILSTLKWKGELVDERLWRVKCPQ